MLPRTVKGVQRPHHHLSSGKSPSVSFDQSEGAPRVGFGLSGVQRGHLGLCGVRGYSNTTDLLKPASTKCGPIVLTLLCAEEEGEEETILTPTPLVPSSLGEVSHTTYPFFNYLGDFLWQPRGLFC